MANTKVLIEVRRSEPNAFLSHSSAVSSDLEATKQAEAAIANLAGFGLELEEGFDPVPMLSDDKLDAGTIDLLGAFDTDETAPDMSSQTTVVACELPSDRLKELSERDDVTVWPNSEMKLIDGPGLADLLDLAPSDGGIDCRPFRDGVSIDVIRQLLTVDAVWRDGFRGQNVVVGIVDEGVNGENYPVIGGFSRPNAQRPGTADITSHGSMCAADVMVAAPAAKLYDYPFLGIPNSGGALRMFQAILDQRRIDGTPQITNRSYGFIGIPNPIQFPNHEVHDLNHPVHRKVREVVTSGAAAFFAAGNCGENCPSGACHSSGIGPGRSIHGSNSLEEVIAVAAVNSRHERIGYSSQGPGMFEAQKPDIASYSHLFGNFGPGRPGGLSAPFDNGTSAATPVAAGVGALLKSAMRSVTPAQLKEALIGGAISLGTPGWDANTGFGVVNAGAAYMRLRATLLSLESQKAIGMSA